MTASKTVLQRLLGPFVGGDEGFEAMGYSTTRSDAAQITYAGDPTNNVTPNHIGQFCHDTTNDDLYWAHGTAAANWKICAT